MRFMVIRKADADTEAGVMPTKQLIDDMTSYNEMQVKRGAMLEGAGLMPSAKGARVSFANGKPTIHDGPFAEARELIAGYSIIEAGSLAEVIELVKLWPKSDGNGNVQIEIRQIVTAEDLGFDEEQLDRYNRMVEQQQQQ
ncbi:MAG: YciI family protein [Hyphomicrobiales bacterium]|nr:MAG: YciI family protein [Hyphomicrobiales bacterium]